MTEAIRALLLDILGDHERLDKLSLVMDPVSRNMAICFEDLDDQDFRDLAELVPASPAADRGGEYLSEYGIRNIADDIVIIKAGPGKSIEGGPGWPKDRELP